MLPLCQLLSSVIHMKTTFPANQHNISGSWHHTLFSVVFMKAACKLKRKKALAADVKFSGKVHESDLDEDTGVNILNVNIPLVHLEHKLHTFFDMLIK